MSHRSDVDAVEGLVRAHPFLAPLLNEHAEYNFGEVLPHLFLGEVINWLIANWSTHPKDCQSILAWLDYAYATGDDPVRELVVVSGVENIPSPGKPGSQIRDALSPALRDTDPWSKT